MRRNLMKELGTPPILKRYKSYRPKPDKVVRKERCAVCGMSEEHDAAQLDRCQKMMKWLLEVR